MLSPSLNQCIDNHFVRILLDIADYGLSIARGDKGLKRNAALFSAVSLSITAST